MPSGTSSTVRHLQVTSQRGVPVAVRCCFPREALAYLPVHMNVSDGARVHTTYSQSSSRGRC